MLLDQLTGRLGAVIEAGTVNAYRTAAVDAVAADLLAREQAKVLAIFGAGNQAGFEVMALARCTRAAVLSAAVNEVAEER